MGGGFVSLLLSDREFGLIVDALKVYGRVVDYGSLKSEVDRVIEVLNSFRSVNFPVIAVNPKPSLWIKIKALLFGSVYVYTDLNSCCGRPLEVYLSYCRRHRVFFYHLYGGRVKCPLCLKEAD